MGVQTTQSPRGQILVHDGDEVGHNPRSGVGAEISLVNRIGSTMVADVRSGNGGHDFGFRKASINGPYMVKIVAVECIVVGDVAGDGNGDGTDVICVDTSGIGHGLSGAAESGGMEPRDGVKGESPRAGSGEIIHGGYCEGVRLNRSRERSF